MNPTMTVPLAGSATSASRIRSQPSRVVARRLLAEHLLAAAMTASTYSS
jgi:hypothetical protein